MNRPRKASKRLYVEASLDTRNLALDADQSHYLGRVLRCRKGDRIVVFNARGTERQATIASLGRTRPMLALGAAVEPLPEPARETILLQALVKSDAMDTIVQKATELGVASVFAARTDFSVIKLGEERKARKRGHWERIAASACEQCGRHRPPAVALFDSLGAAVDALPDSARRLAFDGRAGQAARFDRLGDEPLCLAIGPEGGWSPPELELLGARGFDLVSLGPRTLRAETAAIAVLAGASLSGDAGDLDRGSSGG